MTDSPPAAPGWWQASDGKWYPPQPRRRKPMDIRRKWIIGLAIGCAVLVLIISSLVARRTGLIKPSIDRQNCAELADTYSEITEGLAPEKSLSTQRKAATDAQVLNQRVAELGGCPSEPSLK